MKTLSEGLTECALYRANKTRKTVFINRTAYANAEAIVRKSAPEGFDFDAFHTVIYIDFSNRFYTFELSSADPNFSIELINAEPEGNGICDCEYLINGAQTVHLWDDDYDRYSSGYFKRDLPPGDCEREILKIDDFCTFAQNLHLLYDRWDVWDIIFIADCSLTSDDILIDTPECKAYGHLVDHFLYVTTSSKKFMLPEDMSYAFYGLTRLTDIWGWEHLDTSHVENMSHMFEGCKLNYWDLSGFDTSSAVCMNGMLSHSAGNYNDDDSMHHVLDLRNFSTRTVKEVDNMFMHAFYDVIRLGNLDFDKVVGESCCMAGIGDEVLFDVRSTDDVNLLDLIQRNQHLLPWNLICTEAQKAWFSKAENKDFAEEYFIGFSEVQDWYKD